MDKLELVTFIKYIETWNYEMDVIEQVSGVAYTYENKKSLEAKMRVIRETVTGLAKIGLLKDDLVKEIYTELQLHTEGGDVEVLEEDAITYDEIWSKWEL